MPRTNSFPTGRSSARALPWLLRAAAAFGTLAAAAPARADGVPGLALLRPAEREGAAERLGVDSLGDLPCYEVDQAIDDVTGSFAGKATVRWTNVTGEPVERLPLLLHPNASRELGASAAEAGYLEVSSVTDGDGGMLDYESPRPSLLEVRLGAPLAPGARATVVVRYEGTLRVLPPHANDVFQQAMSAIGSLSSIGLADYGLLATGDGIITAANAYPVVAPFRDGEFDTSPPGRLGDLAYNGVAAFRVRTVVPAGVTVVTNLVDAAPESAGDGAGVVIVSEGLGVRDFVLVAGRDLERTSVERSGTRVSSVYRAKDAAGGAIALETAAAALDSFNRRFGPYPYTELDVAEASLVGGAGGVEFSALVLIAGMLYRSPEDSDSPLATILGLWASLGERIGSALDGRDPEGEDAPPTPAEDLLRGSLEFTVAHEVAHQWFAGLVGNDSRRFPSLDEPLAQYAAGLVVADLHGAEEARRAFDMNVKLNYALYRLLEGTDRPVLRDTAGFRSSVEYAGLVYGKAPYVYEALADSLGADRLHEAIRTAVDRFRFRLVTTEEWIGALEDAAGGGDSGVRAAFRRWLEEAHGDEDLGVDENGDFVIDTLFPPDVAGALRQSFAVLGMPPAQMLRALFGGSVGDDAPIGPGIDPRDALRLLEP
ncbi:MAG: hypothetical protein HY907_17455 [Deltaproteobacteria bacterium]|nr:hypothetical protein [Deltaproteobacteria bacterium]